MAEDSDDIGEYRDAIEGILLNGEVLEAVFPAATGPDADGQPALGVTSHRLVHCERSLKRGSHDRWVFRSILYSRVEGIELTRHESFRRDRIETWSAIDVRLGRDSLHWHFTQFGMAREVHDRILAHMLAV